MNGYVNAEENTKTVHRFWEALDGNLELLDEICAPDLRIVEPQIHEQRFESLDQFREYVSQGGPSGAVYKAVDIEPIGNSLIVDTTWTPPGGGEPQRWKVIWSFWDGKVTRIDGKRL